MTDGVTVQNLLRERVAEEVRALLARRQMTGAELAAKIERSPMYVSRRVRGEVAFDLDDLQRIADVFGVAPADLLPSEENRLKKFYGSPAHRPNRAAVTRTAVSRPIVPRPQRPSAVRPISVVPVTRRRPGPVGPMARAR